MKAKRNLELDELFAEARGAYPEVEASPNFLAEVWRKIEERRAPSWLAWLGDWSPRLALAGSLAAAVLTVTAAMNHQANRSQELIESTYVEALTLDSLDEHDTAQWILAGLPR